MMINYEIKIDRGIASSRVWRRPELDAEHAARFAKQMLAKMAELATGTQAKGAILDLREAPPVVGPKAQQTLIQLVQHWEKAGRRIAVLAGDNGVQQLQLARIVRHHAPRHGCMSSSLAEALRWATASTLE